MKPSAKVDDYVSKGLVPANVGVILSHFVVSYANAATDNGYQVEQVDPLVNKFLDLIMDQIQNPFVFESFHQKMTHPFNFYQFGLDLVRPLIDFKKSTIHGLNYLKEIQDSLNRNENVILFGNHQTEPDPQAICILLEKEFPDVVEKLIFVAGHRVTSDPFAVPVSKGYNLLCIYSKRYMDSPPEEKQKKMIHNQRTMKKMTQLLSEGGKCIYVAPSGGRDRRNAAGEIELAPFDPQSIEMFKFVGEHCGRPTHYYPLALGTYDLLPPPSSIESELGENRRVCCTPIHVGFGPSIDMQACQKDDIATKQEKRQWRADYIWTLVCQEYERLMKN